MDLASPTGNHLVSLSPTTPAAQGRHSPGDLKTPTHYPIKMVFGFRVSYHDSQRASAQRPPVCPCARCFNGAGEEQALREACQSPARTLAPVGHIKTPGADAAPTAKRFGFALGRRRSDGSVASDLWPLRKRSTDGQSSSEGDKI